MSEEYNKNEGAKEQRNGQGIMHGTNGHELRTKLRATYNNRP